MNGNRTMPASSLVSIIITSYNYGRYLAECINSAYDNRIRATLKPNEGPASSWNLGFAQSRGEFVLFLDSDDALLPTAVETALKSFDAPDVVRVQWPLWQINASGDRTGGFI